MDTIFAFWETDTQIIVADITEVVQETMERVKEVTGTPAPPSMVESLLKEQIKADYIKHFPNKEAVISVLAKGGIDQCKTIQYLN